MKTTQRDFKIGRHGRKGGMAKRTVVIPSLMRGALWGMLFSALIGLSALWLLLELTQR